MWYKTKKGWGKEREELRNSIDMYVRGSTVIETTHPDQAP